MFTGIVAGLGEVAEADHAAGGSRLVVTGAPLQGVEVGDSVAVNGVCLTAVTVDATGVAFSVVPETIERTNLGGLSTGSAVNLELPLGAAGRFDGHIVQGHVDGVAKVRSVESEGDGKRVWLDPPAHLLRYVAVKGSVCLDGVSLTVAALDASGFAVALIPHTLEVTTFGGVRPGEEINVEVDVLAKYVERMLEARS